MPTKNSPGVIYKIVSRSLKTWIPSLFWAIALLVISTISANRLPKLDMALSADKIGHFIAYGIFAILLASALAARPVEKVGFTAFCIAGGYGLAMEIVQYAFFPGRYFEFWDIVANISGALAAIGMRKIFI